MELAHVKANNGRNELLPAVFGRLFHYGGSMKSEVVASAAKAVPAVGGNLWLWLTSHDINWWVAVATIAYIGLQAYYLVKNKGKRALLDG
ncbi:hypothetical protein LGN28_13055 [Burkholderia cepacia]|nr:hypothetical protein [Burkholderia cepacia]